MIRSANIIAGSIRLLNTISFNCFKMNHMVAQYWVLHPLWLLLFIDMEVWHSPICINHSLSHLERHEFHTNWLSIHTKKISEKQFLDHSATHDTHLINDSICQLIVCEDTVPQCKARTICLSGFHPNFFFFFLSFYCSQSINTALHCAGQILVMILRGEDATTNG